MPFKDMLQILQKRNKGKIVLIKLGSFYMATGRDAVLLNKKLGLKCSCFSNNVCKVGVPIGSIEKYRKQLDDLKLAYTIYDYDKEKSELKEICTKIGKWNKETNNNINCLVCDGVRRYKEDKYMEALVKYLSKENYEIE